MEFDTWKENANKLAQPLAQAVTCHTKKSKLNDSQIQYLYFMIKRIYIDTSVFGGRFDDEFEDATKPFFETILQQKIQIIVSEVLELELYKAPAHIVDFYESIPEKIIERVELTEEARELAEKYIIEKVVGKTSRADCQHIAMATVYRADVLASWNFKHIVNLEKIRGYNAINFREGYPMIEIRTPKEIFEHEDD